MRHFDGGRSLAIGEVSCRGVNGKSRALFDVLAISEDNVPRLLGDCGPALPAGPLCGGSNGLATPLLLFLGSTLLCVLTLGVVGGGLFHNVEGGGGGSASPPWLALTLMAAGALLDHTEYAAAVDVLGGVEVVG